MKKPFKKVAVVGTGILGTQIAMLAANVGYKVKVYDPRDGPLNLLSTTAKRNSRRRRLSRLFPGRDGSGSGRPLCR